MKKDTSGRTVILRTDALRRWPSVRERVFGQNEFRRFAVRVRGKAGIGLYSRRRQNCGKLPKRLTARRQQAHNGRQNRFAVNVDVFSCANEAVFAEMVEKIRVYLHHGIFRIRYGAVIGQGALPVFSVGNQKGLVFFRMRRPFFAVGFEQVLHTQGHGVGIDGPLFSNIKIIKTQKKKKGVSNVKSLIILQNKENPKPKGAEQRDLSVLQRRCTFERECLFRRKVYVWRYAFLFKTKKA